jgi:hypothetical protein
MKYKNPGDLFNAFQAKKKEREEKHKNFIAKAIKHPGALHRELGIPVGKKIPAKTLARAAKKGGKEGKRARLAETLKSFHHKKRKMTLAEDTAYDKKHGIKEGSERDLREDKKHGVKDKMKSSKMCKTHKKMCKMCKVHKKMHCKTC